MIRRCMIAVPQQQKQIASTTTTATKATMASALRRGRQRIATTVAAAASSHQLPRHRSTVQHQHPQPGTTTTNTMAGPAETSVRLMNELSTLTTTAIPIAPLHTVVIVSKPSREIIDKTRVVASWLIKRTKGLRVILVGEHFRGLSWVDKDESVKVWTPETCRSTSADAEMIDLVITLGGDGTVLYASHLFQGRVPPILPFHLGSLGFLTVFDFDAHQDILTRIMNGEPQRTNLRMRLRHSVFRAPPNFNDLALKELDKDLGAEHHRDGIVGGEIVMHYPRPTDAPVHTGVVLNEVVVDRGANPTMMTLELYAGDLHLTTLLADGLVIATPTGSTAYNLSAHGPLVHPDKASILVTPICPHTLTARPMVLPPNIDLRIHVAWDTRSTAWISFDGRDRLELNAGDSVHIRASRHPFLTVCKEDSSSDWFNSLKSSLGWNLRRRQRALL